METLRASASCAKSLNWISARPTSLTHEAGSTLMLKCLKRLEMVLSAKEVAEGAGVGGAGGGSPEQWSGLVTIVFALQVSYTDPWE